MNKNYNARGDLDKLLENFPADPGSAPSIFSFRFLYTTESNFDSTTGYPVDEERVVLDDDCAAGEQRGAVPGHLDCSPHASGRF